MGAYGRDIRVTTTREPLPDLTDDGIRRLMEECLRAAERCRLDAVQRATALKEIFRIRHERSGQKLTEEEITAYEGGEGSRDGLWKKYIAENALYMNRAQFYSAVLQGRLAYRQMRCCGADGPKVPAQRT